MKPVTSQPIRDRTDLTCQKPTPKTHPNPTLLLNLSNPSSTCRAFSQHTSAARILELLEMTEYKFYLHLAGGKPIHYRNAETNTLMDVLGKH